MTRFSQFICNQGKFLLANLWYALLCALVLALTPFTVWLSISVIALVTLRRGWRDGGLLLLPVVCAHVALSLLNIAFLPALYNTLLTFVPCYIAAVVLRYTMSWPIVAGIFIVETIVVALFMQISMPDFIMAQYVYIQSVIQELQPNNAFMALVNEKNALSQLMVANYFLGLQMVAVALSSVTSLMLSRSVQSKIYNPGGFVQEMLSFRGHKIALLLLVIVFYAVNQKNVLAVNLLPMLVVYFLFAGLSLSFQLLAKKKMLGSVLMLVTPLFILPFIMLPFYVILGSLDSLINFRFYLRPDAGKTT